MKSLINLLQGELAVAALKDDKTMAKLAEQFDVHPNQIKELHAKISQLTV